MYPLGNKDTIGDGNMRQLFCVTFSPTGTSQKAAEQIAQAFGGKQVMLDLCKVIRRG